MTSQIRGNLAENPFFKTAFLYKSCVGNLKQKYPLSLPFFIHNRWYITPHYKKGIYLRPKYENEMDENHEKA